MISHEPLKVDDLLKIVNDDSPEMRLHEINHAVMEKSKQQITFANPKISIKDSIPIVYSNSITAIQGQKGSHKSRFTEMIVAVAISKEQKVICGMNRESTAPTMIFIDTERSLNDSLPFAIQRIKKIAGYEITDDIPKFYVTSTIGTERAQRLQVVKNFIAEIRMIHPDDEFLIVIDVLSDLIVDFNSTADSMIAIDFLNEIINDFDCSVVAVLHENPNQNSKESKMRGHAGTELLNKSSAVWQISYNFADDVITLSALHLRNHKRPGKILLRVNESLGLEIADETTIMQIHSEKLLLFSESVYDLLHNYSLTQKDLITELTKIHNISKNTCLLRLDEIYENPTKYGYNLQIEKKGRMKIYSIGNQKQLAV